MRASWIPRERKQKSPGLLRLSLELQGVTSTASWGSEDSESAQFQGAGTQTPPPMGGVAGPCREESTAGSHLCRQPSHSSSWPPVGLARHQRLRRKAPSTCEMPTRYPGSEESFIKKKSKEQGYDIPPKSESLSRLALHSNWEAEHTN